MITSQASHDNTLVDQLNSITTTQPVDTDTNKRSIENKLCNIKTKVSHLIGNIPRDAYKRIKAAGKYTYEKIDAHPRIAASIFAVTWTALIALVLYEYKLYENHEASNPIIDASTFITTLINALVTLALLAYTYKALTNLNATLPMIVAARSMVAAISTLTVAMVATVVYALSESYQSDSIC